MANRRFNLNTLREKLVIESDLSSIMRYYSDITQENPEELLGNEIENEFLVEQLLTATNKIFTKKLTSLDNVIMKENTLKKCINGTATPHGCPMMYFFFTDTAMGFAAFLINGKEYLVRIVSEN
jgi:hypothetical protein